MASAPADRLFQHPEIQPRTRVLVMGLGGAGCNMAANMSALWVDGPPVIAVNTDAQALAGCNVNRVLQIGKRTTKGLGANSDPNIGRMAVQESEDEIAECLHDIDLLFLAVGLGGGTGSGAAPLIAAMAHQMNVMTLCFAVMPFPYESDSRKRQAEEALRALQKSADAVIALPNEKLIELVDTHAGIEEAFRASDRQVAATVDALWKLLCFRGVLNVDFADLRHLVEKSRGLCTFGYGEATGPSRVPSAVKALLDSPYLNKGRSISEATALLVNIAGGPDLTLADMQAIMTQLGKMAPGSANIYYGARIDPAMKGRITLTAIATDGDRAETRPAPAPIPDSEEVDVRAKAKKAAGKDQVEIKFPSEDKGKFANSSPTTFRGEDLDIPTYIRRSYKLSFER